MNVHSLTSCFDDSAYGKKGINGKKGMSRKINNSITIILLIIITTHAS